MRSRKRLRRAAYVSRYFSAMSRQIASPSIALPAARGRWCGLAFVASSTVGNGPRANPSAEEKEIFSSRTDAFAAVRRSKDCLRDALTECFLDPRGLQKELSYTDLRYRCLPPERVHHEAEQGPRPPGVRLHDDRPRDGGARRHDRGRPREDEDT